MRKLAVSLGIAIFGIAMVTASARADGMRCGSKLVVDRDTHESVRRKCGEPAEVSRQVVWRRPYFGYRGYYLSDELIEVPVEIWTYNFGPNKFMRRVHFVGGLVEEIETLGYGYHEK